MDKILNIFKPSKENGVQKKNKVSPTIQLTLNLLRQYITEPNKEIQQLITEASQCEIKKQNRFFIWLLFLNIIPYNNPKEWNNIIYDLRSDFLNSRNSYFTEDITNFIKTQATKGSEEYETLKKKLSQEDYEMLSIIKLDIARTHQTLSLFTEQSTKETLINVLFIYCKNNTDLGYNQGMNEIVALLYRVLYQKAKIHNNSISDDITFLYDLLYTKNSTFFEADLYTIFSTVMKKGLHSFFSYSHQKYSHSLSKMNDQERLQLTKEIIEKSDDSEIRKRIYSLFYIELKEFDSELFNSINGVADPDLFLLRWMLCLFTREFDVEQVLRVWDIILAFEFFEFHYQKNSLRKKTHLNFAEYICLSMIEYIKKDILKSNDNTIILSTIMHFPIKSNVDLIINEAIKISNKIYKCNIFKEKGLFDSIKLRFKD